MALDNICCSSTMELMDIDNDFKIVRGEITDEQWDAARPLIQRLYMDKNMPFLHVANAIKTEYGFCPTKRQFHRRVGVKWALRKNSTIKQRRFAVQQLESKLANPEQTSVTFQKIDRPFNKAKVRRWKKELGNTPVLDAQLVFSDGSKEVLVFPEPITQPSVIVAVKSAPLLLGSDYGKSEHQTLWGWTRITESPDLTALFATLKVSGFDPEDDNIPPLSLSESDDADSVGEEPQFLSSSDLINLQRSVMQTKEVKQTSVLPPSDLVLYNHSPNIAFSAQEKGSVDISDKLYTAYASFSPYDELYPFVNNCMARSLSKSRNLHISHIFLKEKLEKLSQIMSRTHPAVISTMEDLAIEYEGQGKYMPAESLYRKVLSANEEVYGFDHPTTLNACFNLVRVLQWLSSFEEAQRLHRRLHSTILATSHANYDLVLRSMVLLANNEYYQDNLEEAERLERQSLQIQLNSGGLKHEGAINAIARFGMTMKQKGHSSKAEKLFRIAVQLQEQVPEVMEADKCFNLGELASCLSKREMFPESMTLFRGVVERAKLRLGERHPRFLEIMHNFANLLNQQGDIPQSIDIYRNVVSVTRELLGEINKDTLDAMSNLARALHYDAGRSDEACAWFKKSFSGYTAIFGIEHVESLNECYRLGSCYQKLGQHRKALKHYQDALEKLKMVQGSFKSEIIGFEKRVAWLQHCLARKEAGLIEAGEEFEEYDSNEYDDSDEDEKMEGV